MKTMFKRSAISLIVAGLASMSYAAAPSKAVDNGFSPQFHGGFIGVEGAYLRPQNGDLDYVTIFPNNPGEVFNTRSLSPSYNWNWRVYGGIKFTDNDDITASWERIRNSEKEHLGFDGTISTWPRWGLPGEWSNVSGRVNFDLDDAYLVWGHTVHYNNPWTFRFGAGVEYAKLDSDMRVVVDTVDVPDEAFGFDANSSIKGIGPRAEFDMAYHFTNDFAFFGQVNAAAIISNRDISLNPTVDSWNNNDLVFNASKFQERHVVIPKLGLRLGASYGYTFGQAGGEGVPSRFTTVALEAGWQADTYVHAIERPSQNYFFTSAMMMQPAFSAEPGHSKTSNFTDQGLFVGLKVSSDWM